MWAIYNVLTHLKEIKSTLPELSSIWLFTDFESAISRLQGGPGAQTEQLADAIWKQIMALSDYKITFQWVPGHAEIQGNEEAYIVAKEASRST